MMDPRQLIGSARPPEGVATVIVAIDSCGGAGKSTLAAELSADFDAVVVHTDDFASWDHPLDWWPRLRDEALVPLGDGRPAHFRRYDWDARVLAEEIEVAPGGVVIVEGVSSSRRAFRPWLAASIWVEAPRELRLLRGLARDGESARAQWETWMAAEDAWIDSESPAAACDLIVHTG
jgi:uridine kinase